MRISKKLTAVIVALALLLIDHWTPILSPELRFGLVAGIVAYIPVQGLIDFKKAF